MYRRVLFICLFVVCGVLVSAEVSQAGFGISPPYVKPTNPIFPGSHYEQRITLLRSTAEDDLVAEVVINAPEIQDWISIKNGNEFEFPEGSVRASMVVVVDIPESAEVGNYQGHLNIRIRPKGGNKGGGVAIALGARVDIDLTVTNEELLEFVIRTTDIPTFETLGKPWKWPIFSWFLYRINLFMKIENTGNAPIAPSKVQLDIWDIAETEMLESSIDTSIEEVEPFKLGTVAASFPTKLPAGQYWGRIKVFKDNDIVLKNKLTFTIAKHGSLEERTSLGARPWILLGIYLIILAIIIFVLVKIRIWKQGWKLIKLITWPARYTWNRFRKLLNITKIKFFRWLHRKSARYQTKEEGEIDRKKYKEKE